MKYSNNTSHSDQRTTCHTVSCKTSVNFDGDTTFLLLKLKQRLEKQHKVKMTNRQLLYSLMQEKLESLDAPKGSTKNFSTGTGEKFAQNPGTSYQL